MRPPITAWIVAAAAALAALPSAAAADVRVALDNGTLTVTADAAGAGLTYTVEPRGPSEPLGDSWIVGVSGADVVAQPPCERIQGTGGLTAAGRCPRSAVTRVDLALGNGADAAHVKGDMPVHLAAGGGDDQVDVTLTRGDAAVEMGDGADSAQVSSDAGAVSLDGGAGDDQLIARSVAPNPVTVLGGDGNDDLQMHGGPGREDGGAGNDSMDPGLSDGDRDTITCGPGQDLASNPLLRQEDQVADDCPPTDIVTVAKKGAVVIAGGASRATIGYTALQPVALTGVRLIRSIGLRRTTLARLGAMQLRGTGTLRFRLPASARRTLGKRKHTNLRLVGTLRSPGGDTAPLVPNEPLIPFSVSRRG